MEEARVKDYTESLSTESAIAILRPLLYFNAVRILRQLMTMNWPDMLVKSGEFSKNMLQKYIKLCTLQRIQEKQPECFENIS